ncbi:MAG TPA: hypothetical protein VMM12_02190, partial [Longimicrobiales bacterium]|nr:hypothetical protein [Longimicrobiales bacterium]
GTVKLSPSKPILPGPKQVFREYEDGIAVRDTITRAGEVAAGEPLLRAVMREGRRLEAGRASLEEARRHAASQIRSLPQRLRLLTRADPAYPVQISRALRAFQEEVTREARAERKVPS